MLTCVIIYDISITMYTRKIQLQTPNMLMTEYRSPYKVGKIVAICDNGGRFSVKTSGEPAIIVLTPDRETIGTEGYLCYATVEVTDIDRNPCRSAVEMIYFSVDNGRLLALGTSNPRDIEPFLGHAHSLYDGRLMAVLI